ncbi:GNAT family N-acetyltransferase [Tunicatimonas pelagia]|uniref:GNAT family N-acetyltransferase n=1 Tax=Tunicatimonas pelagia TaxID=931531 RepID=UPI00266587DA|nr:GNAT family N-acetyltransferase [Tunicatimonas pelagia]WKN40846.1 GNAT family N-acetyltransferase [Tunicatimonas pelagia]
MDIIRENIDNLTSLWMTVGKEMGAYRSESHFNYSYLHYSEWPNKLWFHTDVTEENVLAAREQIQSLSNLLGISYWDIYGSNSYELLEIGGFKKASEQIGMYLALSDLLKVDTFLHLEEVKSKDSALLWEDVFLRGFDYKISHRLLLPDYESTHFFIAYQEQVPVGTAVLHAKNNQVMGVHSMSILPEMRRQGYAEQIMRILLNKSISQGYTWVTLQASAMGKGLYEKLGFKEQFIMKNYILK